MFVVAALPFENDLPSIDAARLTGFSGYSNGMNRGSKQTLNLPGLAGYNDSCVSYRNLSGLP